MNRSLCLLLTEIRGGGAERVALTIADGLSEVMKLNIITLYGNNNNNHYVGKYHLSSLGFRRSTYIPRYLSYLFKSPIMIWKYIHVLRSQVHPLSLSILSIDNMINIISSRCARNKCIISVHGIRRNPDMGRWILERIQFLLAKNGATKIITVSDGLKKYLIDTYSISPEKISVIYNPVDSLSIREKSVEAISEKNICNSPYPIIVAAGRLNPVKGYGSLLRVVAKLVNSTPVSLVICGDGPLRSKLESMSHELNLTNYVNFIGWTDNPYKYMAKSSLFVLSSFSEGLPMVLIEAMVCGCAILSTDCAPGVREILKDGKYGYICSAPESMDIATHAPLTPAEESMLEGMKRMLSDINLCQKMKEDRDNWIQKFEVNHVIQKYYQVINDCMEDRNES